MGQPLIDLSGKRFGKLVVVGRDTKPKATAHWFVQCDCGSPPKSVQSANLRQGRTRSCGCLHFIPIAERCPIVIFGKPPLTEEQIAQRREAKAHQRRAVRGKWNASNTVQRAAYNRRRLLQRDFGLSEADYEAMLQAQEGACALCRKRPDVGKHLAVDHCHKTGRVRGLLCMLCNTALGKFNDDPERLRDAIAYLTASA